MTILDEIIAHKYKEVAERKQLVSAKSLENSSYFKTPCISLKQQLQRTDLVGIIAEFKRRSPSKGVINGNADADLIPLGYAQAGASALSILTDENFFGGHVNDLVTARKNNNCPILRKDFVVDEYQIIEAKSIGADVILLIAAALDAKRLRELGKTAHDLGLEVLFEIHAPEELDKIHEFIDAVGINNRNLKDFKVDINQSLRLAAQLPANMLKVSESGISQPQTIVDLKKHGFNGFLIGENFMATPQPHLACHDFISQVNELMTKK